MGRLNLTLTGRELANSNVLEEIKKLEGCINLQRHPFDVKAMDVAVSVNIIIDFKDVAFLSAFAMFLYYKLQLAKLEAAAIHRSNHFNIGYVEKQIDKTDSKEQIEGKLNEIANLPEWK